MPVIVKRPLALLDVAEIWDYIADDSEARANAFINTIDQKFKNLSEAPHMGRSRDELGEGMRSFPVSRYIIFYRPLPDGVDIVRVLHSARDIESNPFFDE